MSREISITVINEGVTSFRADVLILKYAQDLHGVDGLVYSLMSAGGREFSLPIENNFILRSAVDAIATSSVLFVGVKPLSFFGYSEIRNFARTSLLYLANAAPKTRHVALTIHGPGYGLDEMEAFESELAGIVDAIVKGNIPSMLSRISFVEQDARRAHRLSESLNRVLPTGRLPVDGTGSLVDLNRGARDTLRNAGNSETSKPHVFVAMPFADTMDDVFHYGIQGAVNNAGYLCERADLSTFTGDVMSWVRQRISSAKLVVADLSSANPNVYLEVGYAWGLQIPTVLLAKDANDLKFDVRGQRCIVYKSIKHLEESLGKELRGL